MPINHIYFWLYLSLKNESVKKIQTFLVLLHSLVNIMIFRFQGCKLPAYCVTLCDYKCQEIRDFAPGHCRAGKILLLWNLLISESKDKGFCFAHIMTVIYKKWITLFTQPVSHCVCESVNTCEFHSLGYSSVTHRCMCEKKDILRLRWWVGRFPVTQCTVAIEDFLVSPSTFTSLKPYSLGA